MEHPVNILCSLFIFYPKLEPDRLIDFYLPSNCYISQGYLVKRNSWETVIYYHYCCLYLYNLIHRTPPNVSVFIIIDIHLYKTKRPQTFSTTFPKKSDSLLLPQIKVTCGSRLQGNQ